MGEDFLLGGKTFLLGPQGRRGAGGVALGAHERAGVLVHAVE